LVAHVKKALANQEPSTHGTKPTWGMRGRCGHEQDGGDSKGRSN
jgi:hypothetical protein